MGLGHVSDAEEDLDYVCAAEESQGHVFQVCNAEEVLNMSVKEGPGHVCNAEEGLGRVCDAEVGLGYVSDAEEGLGHVSDAGEVLDHVSDAGEDLGHVSVLRRI